jgi:hypothetical protein
MVETPRELQAKLAEIAVDLCPEYKLSDGTRALPRMQNRLLKNPWLATALVLGLLQAWRSRFSMTYDGISYLDMGDAYLRRDWHTAINGYWNPLYAWLQALARVIFHPSPYWEYPVVHLVDYAIFVLTAFAFEYFLKGLLGDREDVIAIRTIAYSIFLWSSLELCRVFMVNPDMLTAASVYTALGILVRAPKSRPIVLAVVLAIGYYAKAVMFPVSLLILVLAWKMLPRREVIKASAAFLLLCAPWILILSHSTGHLTIGDTSRLNYAWYVNNLNRDRFWQGGPPKAGHPIHPARVALDSPRVYEFGGVFPVTYPIWYDQSYWYEGLHLWFAPRLFIRAYRKNVFQFAKMLMCQGGGFLIGWALCFLLQKDRTLRKGWLSGWGTWLFAIATLAFLTAVHLEPRHIAPFVAILFLIPFIALPDRIHPLLSSAIAVGGLACALSFASVTTLLGEPMIPFQVTPTNEASQLASAMEQLGVQPYEQVATVCCVGPRSVFWAHLIRAQIVANLDWSTDFWKLNATDRKRVLDALASSGAKFAISEVAPPDPQEASGWRQVSTSHYYIYSFAADVSSSKPAQSAVAR